jgi:DNA invertase Pin-like site-specific DNA recombinase
MKAITIARVSTEEQRDAGNSLPAQIERMKNYCARKGYEIVDSFSFDESAYKTKRDEFDSILKHVQQSKDKLVVCFDKVDRFSRNVFDKRVAALYELATQDKIELHFASDSLVINANISATEKFQFNINLGLAKYYSDAISDNTRRAFEQKRRNGEWTGKGPIGYVNIVDDRGNKDIVFDEERAYHVRRIFELYATGNFSLAKLRDQVTKEGLRTTEGKVLSKSMYEFVLKNPFYYGEARSVRGTYPHKYMPLVSRQLWDQCQQVFRGWNKKPFQHGTKPYVLRGLLRCARCGCAMSPEMAKAKYVYYACTNAKGTCEKVYVPEKDLLKPVYEVLEAMSTLSEERIEEVVEGLRASHKHKQKYLENAVTGLRKEYDTLQTRLDKIYIDYLDGRITQDAYDKYVHQFKSRQQEINLLLEGHTDADEGYHIAASTVLNLAKRALQIFESSEVEEKRALLNFLLQNSVVDGKKPMYSLRSPFDTILTFANRPNWLRDQDSNLEPTPYT